MEQHGQVNHVVYGRWSNTDKLIM